MVIRGLDAGTMELAEVYSVMRGSPQLDKLVEDLAIATNDTVRPDNPFAPPKALNLL